MVRAVVFDIGETLMSEDRLWRLWAAWLGVPESVFFAVLGATIERGEHHLRAFELLRPGFDLKTEQAARIAAGIPDQFEAGDLYPDVIPCLTALRQRGLLIGAAGNQPAEAERVLQDLGVSFDLIASSARWGVEKPSPAFFRRIGQELKLPLNSIAYVGDRVDNDVLPAADAGMVAVFLRRGPWGFLHARRTDAARANLRIHDLSELPAALGL
jgi:FMN phosphatase YigB (HAD superfamily)